MPWPWGEREDLTHVSGWEGSLFVVFYSVSCLRFVNPLCTEALVKDRSTGSGCYYGCLARVSVSLSCLKKKTYISFENNSCCFNARPRLRRCSSRPRCFGFRLQAWLKHRTGRVLNSGARLPLPPLGC